MPDSIPPPLPDKATAALAPAPLWRQSLDQHEDVEDGVQGLGGWLFLFGIGRLFAVCSWAFALMKDLTIFTKPGLWAALGTPGSAAYQPYLRAVILYETIGNGVLLLVSISLVALFFARWRVFRPLTIIYLVGMMVFLWADYILALPISTIPEQVRTQLIGSCIAATICALLWVPYFVVSTRVKRTFIR